MDEAAGAALVSKAVTVTHKTTQGHGRKGSKAARRKAPAAAVATQVVAERSAARRVQPRRPRRIMKTSELIARDIIAYICDGGLKAGDALPPEASMLKYYDVGRASLREALRLLEVHGLIQIRAGAKGGPVVGAPSAENLAQILTLYFGLSGATYEDLTDVIRILFPKVAEVVARRRLTQDEVRRLRASVEDGCGTHVPAPARTEAQKAFHRLLAELANNSVWTLLNDAVALIFADHIVATADSSAFHAASESDHKEIADTVIARDVEEARRLMHEHTNRFIEFYRAQMPGIFSQLIEWR
jgi:GntR family transcriptional regulator, transcriptional repressor for pyruvate dehydrogenase complex